MPLTTWPRGGATASTPAPAFERETRSQALLFIHGYNVTFEDALHRTAQLAYDLKFPRPALCYIWPSKGATVLYTQDEGRHKVSHPLAKRSIRMGRLLHTGDELDIPLSEIAERLSRFHACFSVQPDYGRDVRL